MRKLLYACLLLCTAVIFTSWSRLPRHTGKRKYLVSGSVMQIISYCGGAQPPQQVLDSMNKPKGMAFARLFLKLGEDNREHVREVHRIIADTNGNFSIYLPAGHYCFVEGWKAKPIKLSLNQNIDSACMKELYNSCDYKLEVTNKNIRHLQIIFHRPCAYNQPCVIKKRSLPPTKLPQ